MAVEQLNPKKYSDVLIVCNVKFFLEYGPESCENRSFF